jgi:hypothetical protein
VQLGLIVSAVAMLACVAITLALASVFEETALRNKRAEAYAPPLDVIRTEPGPPPAWREWPTLERVTHPVRALIRRLTPRPTEPIDPQRKAQET